ncbi:hypothetical protein P0D75_30605 [Paraburkholderia sediminicola]|uniref:hypothetical protein n=1 Tax=Paraburkholderia sediminicola TaxID=458836 RepID=UPI0038BE0864
MENTSRMVLRSVHLPMEMDDQLRILAFRLGISKADLIRKFVEDGLQVVQRRLAGVELLRAQSDSNNVELRNLRDQLLGTRRPEQEQDYFQSREPDERSV